MYNERVVVLRVRKNVPGIGRKLSNHFNANEVTCNFRPSIKVPDNALILNYGRSQYPIWYSDAMDRGVRFINNPMAVANSVDKRTCLELLSTAGVRTLDWSTDRDVAQQWLNGFNAVIVRHTVTGKQGNGIELIEPNTDKALFLPVAPLYTKYYDKTHEFRVHVVNGRVVDYVQKKRMGAKKLKARGITEVNELVRNHKRGWVFAHNDIIRSSMVEQLALDTVKVLGLDYGGIDILAKVVDGEVIDAVVCESNSAPGMSGPTTFKAYTTAFAQMMEEYQSES